MNRDGSEPEENASEPAEPTNVATDTTNRTVAMDATELNPVASSSMIEPVSDCDDTPEKQKTGIVTEAISPPPPCVTADPLEGEMTEAEREDIDLLLAGESDLLDISEPDEGDLLIGKMDASESEHSAMELCSSDQATASTTNQVPELSLGSSNEVLIDGLTREAGPIITSQIMEPGVVAIPDSTELPTDSHVTSTAAEPAQSVEISSSSAPESGSSEGVSEGACDIADSSVSSSNIAVETAPDISEPGTVSIPVESTNSISQPPVFTTSTAQETPLPPVSSALSLAVPGGLLANLQTVSPSVSAASSPAPSGSSTEPPPG